MSQRSQDDAGGCALLVAVLFALTAIVAAGISLAAVVDPFSSMPPLAEVWEECDDDYATSEDECALSTRFEGFWLHAGVNVAYALTAGGLLLGYGFAVANFRTARRKRFGDKDAATRYDDALSMLVGAAVLVSAIAAIPVVVAAL